MELVFHMEIASHESLMFREMSLGKLHRRHGGADPAVRSSDTVGEHRPKPPGPPTDQPITCDAMLIGKCEKQPFLTLSLTREAGWTLASSINSPPSSSLSHTHSITPQTFSHLKCFC